MLWLQKDQLPVTGEFFFGRDYAEIPLQMKALSVKAGGEEHAPQCALFRIK